MVGITRSKVIVFFVFKHILSVLLILELLFHLARARLKTVFKEGSSGLDGCPREKFRPKNFLPKQRACWCPENTSNNLAAAAKPSQAYVFLVLGCGCACVLFRVVLVRRS
jgi:hypothetical protein